MSVSSIDSNSSDLQAYFKKLREARASDGTDATDASAQGGSTPPGGFVDRFNTALEDQGITGDKLSDLRSQIQSAVDSAKQGGGDCKSIRAAVDSVLEKNGVDLDKFHAEMHPGSKLNGDGDGDADDTSTSTSATDDPTSLESMLKSAGIDPASFKQSLEAMIQNVSNGGDGDVASLFGTAKTGSDVDVFA